jgi:hypothetical protein
MRSGRRPLRVGRPPILGVTRIPDHHWRPDGSPYKRLCRRIKNVSTRARRRPFRSQESLGFRPYGRSRVGVDPGTTRRSLRQAPRARRRTAAPAGVERIVAARRHYVGDSTSSMRTSEPSASSWTRSACAAPRLIHTTSVLPFTVPKHPPPGDMERCFRRDQTGPSRSHRPCRPRRHRSTCRRDDSRWRHIAEATPQRRAPYRAAAAPDAAR